MDDTLVAFFILFSFLPCSLCASPPQAIREETKLNTTFCSKVRFFNTSSRPLVGRAPSHGKRKYQMPPPQAGRLAQGSASPLPNLPAHPPTQPPTRPPARPPPPSPPMLPHVAELESFICDGNFTFYLFSFSGLKKLFPVLCVLTLPDGKLMCAI